MRISRIKAFFSLQGKILFLVLASLPFSLLSPLSHAADKKDFDREITRQKKELADLRNRLEAEQKELKNLREQKESTLGRLDKISGNIKNTEKYLTKLEATEETFTKSLSAVKQELVEVQDRIAERNGVMAKRVRALFISGGPERFALRAWESDQGDFLRKVFFMKRVLRYDRSLVDAGKEDAMAKQKAAVKLNGRITELETFRSHKSREKETFTRAQKEQERNLASIQSDETAKQSALKELEENARLINDIITALEKRRKEELARNKKATVLESSSKYCSPVDGEVVSKYGLQYHATLKTSTKNLGIEIRGAAGTPVRAAVSGEVALITRIPGYGMGVILDNGSGFFTIYANLSGIRLRQGDTVKTCQELGSVSVEAGRVYFEVRKGTKTLDPSEWLRSGGK